MSDDAAKLINQIANSPSLDQITALPPTRFADPATRKALVERLRADRVAWEVKRGDRASASEETEQ